MDGDCNQFFGPWPARMRGHDVEPRKVRSHVIDVGDWPGMAELEAEPAWFAGADGRGAAVDQHRCPERLQQVPDWIELPVVRREPLDRRLILHPHQPEVLDCMLDLFQPFAATPGVDHGPTGKEDVRVVSGQCRYGFVAVAPAR